MAKIFDGKAAFGAPGIEPRWTQSNKDGVGTAYSETSKLWFTLWNGSVTEVYYPMVDLPQIRDLQYLITDGHSFFHEEKRHLKSKTEKIWDNALGYRVVNSDPEARYQITKEVISDPHLACLLQKTTLTGNIDFLSELKLYALCAPHLGIGGWGNNGHIIEVAGRKLLAAHKVSQKGSQKSDRWLVLGATLPFSKLSCGYVGRSDGWQDLSQNYQLDWAFNQATDGNIGLIGELDLTAAQTFTLGLAFGSSLESALSTLMQSLNIPFEQHKKTFHSQWSRAQEGNALEKIAQDNGRLFKSSISLLLAHEDKTYPGATIASLSFPWGEKKGDGDTGGYHLVWTRDMVNSVTGLMAAGNIKTAMRSLTYLMSVQHDDGGFAQNFWLDGEPYWQGMQLDEVAFPILLSWKLSEAGALPKAFDVYPMVIKAAGYLIRHGPATEQERWEENSGYSPSTLACNIAALVCAGAFARQNGDRPLANYIEDYADFLTDHIRAWTVTTAGTLVPGIRRHFIRITPAQIDQPRPNEDPNHSRIKISSRPPGTNAQFSQNQSGEFLAKEIVDAGFLLFVRYGILSANDALVVDSLKVVDAILKVETPNGPCWRRYNHDGYGQQADGSAYEGIGQGRAWPLLTAERGHYELAAGRDVSPYIRAMEKFATETGLLTEQVWDQPDLPQAHMYLGEPTGAAMPLMWAHAEYIKLLRSAQDGRVYDLIPVVAERYLDQSRHKNGCKSFEIWKFHRQVRSMRSQQTLRIQAEAEFRLRWSADDWRTIQETVSQSIDPLAVHYVDILGTDILGANIQSADAQNAVNQTTSVQFTFFWTDSHRWEQRNYTVEIEPLR